jgi:hypothetical protein
MLLPPQLTVSSLGFGELLTLCSSPVWNLCYFRLTSPGLQETFSLCFLLNPWNALTGPCHLLHHSLNPATQGEPHRNF